MRVADYTKSLLAMVSLPGAFVWACQIWLQDLRSGGLDTWRVPHLMPVAGPILLEWPVFLLEL